MCYNAVESSRDDILSKLRKLTEAKGDLSNIIETVPTEEEDVEATAENELGVDEDDGVDLRLTWINHMEKDYCREIFVFNDIFCA